MNLIEALSVALEALGSNRLRTGLSLLGITIGTAAVIMVGAATRSGRFLIFDELMTFGLRSIWVYRVYEKARPGEPTRKGTGIDLSDIEAIQKEIPSIAYVTPIAQQMTWATSDGHYHRVRLQAVNHQHAAINNDEAKTGRLLSWIDDRAGQPVAVIGIDVAQALFPTTDPIGKTIRVGQGSYTVVGVLAPRSRDFLNSVGITGGGHPNERVLVPITAYYKVASRREVEYLQAAVVDPAHAAETAEQVIDLLRRRHRGKYRYRAQVMQTYIDTANKIIGTVSWLGGVAAAISLLVGGIGIMNVLTTAVIERTAEIGLRKAVGARPRDILLQFLLEAVLLCLIGGVLGVVLGSATIVTIERVSGKPELLAWNYVGIAIAVSFLTGILAGLYPAHRAARQDPIEALRYE